MYQSSPARARQSYRHEAFLWRDPSHFSKHLATFVEEGLGLGEPVMVALTHEHLGWVRDALGAHSAQVTYVDMGELGRNPARIIPAWQAFLDEHASTGSPSRGIGEPIWVGRRSEELLECQLHEALLNVALDPQTPFWLLCPYDAERLSPAVLEEAHRSHHALLDATSYRGSTSYEGRSHVDSLFSAELLALPDPQVERSFVAENVRDVFGLVVRYAYAAELWSDAALDLAEAARQVAAGSVSRGAPEVSLRIWNQPHALICELADSTVLDDVLAGRRARDNGDGLWSANQLCDLVQTRSSAAGTTVRLHAWK